MKKKQNRNEVELTEGKPRRFEYLKQRSVQGRIATNFKYSDATLNVKDGVVHMRDQTRLIKSYCECGLNRP
ncbi:hypothetical protein C5745_11730 [Sphingobacterium haloxyli]|uniref:Uncharacterized protein n=1 Tax=Sphingobacterium haloxyli TaxID=2100533 RepID=A0A2S9J2T2_9SPHI|nr:hypothetical protein C5745_11730 [Sphingobacterium haloxyli]